VPALFKNGPEHITTVVQGVRSRLEEHGYESVEQAKGSMSQVASPDPAEFERSNYMRAVVSFTSPYDWRLAPTEPRT
jgi:dihydroorotate dehydrogenase (fumarate)